VEFDENGKIDIYSLKGAEKIKKIPEQYYETLGVEGDVFPKEEYLAMLKDWIKTSGTSLVYGTAKNIKMISLEDHVKFKRKVQEHLEDGSSRISEQKYDYPVVWLIITFDIDVIDDMGTLDGRESVHVVLASRYATGDTNDEPTFKLYTPTGMKEMMEDIQKNPTGLFMLRNLTVEQDKRLDDTWISDGNIWELNGKEYRATEFADYFVNTKYECDGVSFRCRGIGNILLDELRVQEE